MNDITIATANIYWYGLAEAIASSNGLAIDFFHTEADDTRLATMLSRLNADLFCFQEIVDVDRFEAVLSRANPAIRLRDDSGQVVSSLPVAATADSKQRVLLAWNSQRLSLVGWRRLQMWTRSPILAEIRHEPSGRRLQVVGSHAKSSAPESDDTAGQVKRKELASLAEWVAAESHAGRLGDAVLLGDFNSTRNGLDATYLHKGILADWHWREATGQADSVWTTTTDRVVIDHILLSAGLGTRVSKWPEIVYFDRDPAVPPPLPGQTPAPQLLKRLTDHRPVRMTLRFGDES
jgi:endonuclease/exonuclease/phosphatase family metal-dependent hydrolase